MKNEEIIRHTRYLAKKYKDDTVLTFETNLHMAFTDIANHIEEQAEENSKLKAEIEQLKLYASEIINARNLSEETAVSIRARMQREMILQRENERLKERLEIKDNNFELYSNALEEIEQLKAEIEQWQSTNLKLVCELTRIECENNQLKSELEQSVKLPCKVGNTIYLLDFEENRYDEATVEEFVITIDGKIEINSDYEVGTWSEDEYVKYSREEAEQSLKGKVE